MSPILVRPVREQFEHDRVIRVLQARYKRKYEVAINPGAEQNASVGASDMPFFPDLLLYSQDRGRKLQATVEVETIESINTLEAMAEWVQFGRLRTPFFLFVPSSAIDTVRRLCTEYEVNPAEIWTYHTAIDQVRFTMVHRGEPGARPKAAPKPTREAEAKSSRDTEPKANQNTEPKANRNTEPKASRDTEPKASRDSGPRPTVRTAPTPTRPVSAAPRPAAAARKSVRPRLSAVKKTSASSSRAKPATRGKAAKSSKGSGRTSAKPSRGLARKTAAKTSAREAKRR